MALRSRSELNECAFPVNNILVSSEIFDAPFSESFKSQYKNSKHDPFDIPRDWWSDSEANQYIQKAKLYVLAADLVLPDLLAFFHDRLKVYLRDKGIRHDILDAVISPEADDLLEIQNRAQALQAFLETEAGTNLLAVYKRAANILKAEEKKFPNEAASYSGPGHVNYLQEHAEKALGAALDRSNTESTAALAKQDFAAALHALAKVHQPAEAFFTDVMVNAEDAALRLNRLRLLGSLRSQLHAVADFSKIAG